MSIQRSRQPNSKQVHHRSSQWPIDTHTQAVFDSLPAHIAVLDSTGTILAVNTAWHRFAEAHGYTHAGHGVGLNYLEICRQAAESADARAAEQALRAILAHEQTEYSYEYACHNFDQQHWFRFRAARFVGDGPISVIITHEEITDYKVREARSRRLEAAHRLASKQTEQALNETRNRLQALFDHAQEAFLLVDDAGYYIDANPAACLLTGYSHAEILRLNIADLTPPAQRPSVPAEWQAFRAAGAERGEFRLLRKDGSLVPVEFIAVTQIVPGVHLSVLRDITRRHETEERVRNNTKRLDILHEIDRAILSARSVEDIAQAALDVMYRMKPFGRGSILLFDFELGEFQLVAVCQNGMPLEVPERRFLIADMPETEAMLPALRRGELCTFDLRTMMPHWIEADELVARGMRYQICTPLFFQGELFGSIQFVVPTQALFDSVYVPIIDEMLDSLAIGLQQARLFEQVRIGRERLHELSHRLVAAQELERRQLASDLHDQSGQNLAVLNMNLTIARNQLARESPERVERRLADAIQIVDQTVEQIRNVMAELRPAILDDSGLVAALRWFARQFARQTDLVVLIEIEEPRSAPRLSSELETALFRIAQEALTNVVKHARATVATLTLTLVDQPIRLAISDDGIGFIPGAPRRPKQRWSLGLMTMQERVEAVGGRLAIDSAPGQGTRIIAEVTR